MDCLDNFLFRFSCKCPRDDVHQQILHTDTCTVPRRFEESFWNNELSWHNEVVDKYLRIRINRQASRAARPVFVDEDDDLKGMFWMLTVNPDPKRITNIKKFINDVHKHFQTKMYKKVLYVFEQRSKDPSDFHGIHIHVVLERNQSPAIVKRALKLRFSTYTDVTNPNFYVLKNVTDQLGALEYMRHKTSPSKKAKSLVDVSFRQSLGLDSIYEVNNT